MLVYFINQKRKQKETMDINFTQEDLQFRDEIRDWLENGGYPSHVKHKTDNGIALTKQDMIDFHKAVSAKGWMGYNWPVAVSYTHLTLPTKA